jgi:hypothetical protein
MVILKTHPAIHSIPRIEAWFNVHLQEPCRSPPGFAASAADIPPARPHFRSGLKGIPHKALITAEPSITNDKEPVQTVQLYGERGYRYTLNSSAGAAILARPMVAVRPL